MTVFSPENSFFNITKFLIWLICHRTTWMTTPVEHSSNRILNDSSYFQEALADPKYLFQLEGWNFFDASFFLITFHLFRLQLSAVVAYYERDSSEDG